MENGYKVQRGTTLRQHTTPLPTTAAAPTPANLLRPREEGITVRVLCSLTATEGPNKAAKICLCRRKGPLSFHPGSMGAAPATSRVVPRTQIKVTKLPKERQQEQTHTQRGPKHPSTIAGSGKTKRRTREVERRRRPWRRPRMAAHYIGQG